MVNANTIFLASAALLSSAVQAHPGPHTEPDAGILTARSMKARSCSNQIGAMKQKRHLERQREFARKRDTESSFVEPNYDFINNASCILAPELSNGPYWLPASEYLRQNVTENERGVPLHIDIGVIDVNTCEPMENVLLSIWHCNATGAYSSFEANDPNVDFGVILQNSDHPANSTDYRDLASSNGTFLRGMWPTDSHGAAEFQTIFPGFYIGRSIHIHVQVHTKWTLTEDGRVNSSRVVETGQIFAAEDLTSQIMRLEPYVRHTEVGRWHNDVDSIFNQASLASEANVVMDTVPLDGLDYNNGVQGYITLAVDTSSIKDGAAPRVPLPGVRVSNYSAVISASPYLTHYLESTATATSTFTAWL